MFSCEFCETFKNTFFYRTFPVAASEVNKSVGTNCICELQLDKSTKVVVRRSSVKQVFLEISLNSQEKVCARASFLINLQVFSCEFCEISKDTFFYRTPLVAASKSSRVLNSINNLFGLLFVKIIPIHTVYHIFWNCSQHSNISL